MTSTPAGTWIRTAATALAVGLALTLGVRATTADDDADAAWRARLDRRTTKLEATTAELDGQAPGAPARALPQRVVALDARVRALEARAGRTSGAVRGEADLSLLTMDVTLLEARLNALLAARAPKKEAPPSPDRDAPAADAKGKAGARVSPAVAKWPDAVRFSATAKFVYAETGEWISTTDDEGVTRRDFLMSGYQGTLGLSLRAENLKQDVRGVVVRVGIRMKDPFATEASPYRVYDVRWTASSRVFGNDSLKNLPAYDVVSVPGPIRWTDGPRETSMAVDAEAYVLSATLASGEEVAFEPPKFGAK